MIITRKMYSSYQKVIKDGLPGDYGGNPYGLTQLVPEGDIVSSDDVLVFPEISSCVAVVGSRAGTDARRAVLVGTHLTQLATHEELAAVAAEMKKQAGLRAADGFDRLLVFGILEKDPRAAGTDRLSGDPTPVARVIADALATDLGSTRTLDQHDKERMPHYFPKVADLGHSTAWYKATLGELGAIKLEMALKTGNEQLDDYRGAEPIEVATRPV